MYVFNLIGGGRCQTCKSRDINENDSNCCNLCASTNGQQHTDNCNSNNMCMNGCGRIGSENGICCQNCIKDHIDMVKHTVSCTAKNVMCINGCGRNQIGGSTCCTNCSPSNNNHSHNCEIVNNTKMPLIETSKTDNMQSEDFILYLLNDKNVPIDSIKIASANNASGSVSQMIKQDVNRKNNGKKYTFQMQNGVVDGQLKNIFNEIKNLLTSMPNFGNINVEVTPKLTNNKLANNTQVQIIM